MYSRDIGDQIVTFGVSGKLIRNTLVMYDRQTESLWSQLLGEAVDGPLSGSALAYVPAVHVTWSSWRSENPETLALVKGAAGAQDPYQAYYQSDRTGVIAEAFFDERLYAKEFVLGVAGKREAIAFPFSRLNGTPLVEELLEEEPLLVLFDPGSGGGRVYSRAVAGRTLTFEWVGDSRTQIRDNETATTWSAASGAALAGPLSGARLNPIKATAAFWFGWKDWYPHSRIYGAALN